MEKDTSDYGESEPPYKKRHLVKQEDQVSSTPDSGRTIICIEESEIRQTSRIPKLMELSPCLRESGTELGSNSLRMPSSNKGKDPISAETAHRRKNLALKRASSAVYSNQAVGVGHIQREMVLKDFADEEIMQAVDDLPQFAVPSSAVDSGTSLVVFI